MNGYELGKDIQEIKAALMRLGASVGGPPPAQANPPGQSPAPSGGGSIVVLSDVGLAVRVDDVEVGGGELRFHIVATVSYKNNKWDFLNARVALSATHLCEDLDEVKNDLFVVKNQKACLIFAEAKIEYCCTARFRPIPDTERDICIKIDVPLPAAVAAAR